ncbi:MAG: GtrA family protein [Boseongicola sp.]
MRIFADNRQGLRFAIVGLLVAAFYVVAYSVLVSAGLSNVVANIVAFLSAVIIQYLGQTSWTFRKPLKVRRQWLRFGVMISVGLIYSTLITNNVAPPLGWPASVAAFVVAVSLPVINFLVLRFWVYNKPVYGKANENTRILRWFF